MEIQNYIRKCKLAAVKFPEHVNNVIADKIK